MKLSKLLKYALLVTGEEKWLGKDANDYENLNFIDLLLRMPSTRSHGNPSCHVSVRRPYKQLNLLYLINSHHRRKRSGTERHFTIKTIAEVSILD